MTRLYVVCEGLTEVNFVQDILKPHIEGRSSGRVEVAAPNSRGQTAYSKLNKDVRTLLSSSDVVVTTLVDVFKLPTDFPGFDEPDKEDNPYHRVEHLEARFGESINDRRFWPHFQLHEFEALLLTDVASLASYYPNRRKELKELAKRIEHDFKTPEHVNRETPPSWRIKQIVPEYAKNPAGVITMLEIGIDRIREKCLHFDRWMKRLETLA